MLRPSRLGTHSELLGTWMRFDVHANYMYRSFEAFRPLARRHSKFNLADPLANRSVASEVEVGSTLRTNSPRTSPRLQHPSFNRPIIPPDRRRASKRFARFVRIAERDHIITIRADQPAGHVGAAGAAPRPVPSHATVTPDKNTHPAGVSSMTDVMEIIKHAMTLDVGMSALPNGVAAVELVIEDLKRQQMVDIHTSMNPDGTIIQKEMQPLASQSQARIRGRSMAVGFDYPREPATPAGGDEYAQRSSSGHVAHSGEDHYRELLCSAYFLQLRMYTRKYVSGKMALSHFARLNMETLQHLVKFSPYLRVPRNEDWNGNDETKQNFPATPNDSSQRDSINETLKNAERPSFQNSRQDSFRFVLHTGHM